MEDEFNKYNTEPQDQIDEILTEDEFFYWNKKQMILAISHQVKKIKSWSMKEAEESIPGKAPPGGFCDIRASNMGCEEDHQCGMAISDDENI